MENSEIPAEDTTTTVISTTRIKPNIRYDSSYFRKKEGILKVLQILLCVLGCICIQCTDFSLHSTGKWFTTVGVFGFLVTGILLVCYLFHVVEKCYKTPWLIFELLYCSVEALCFMIASCMAAIIERKAFQAAAFFGLSAMVAYGIDALLKFFANKAGELAQGKKKIIKETTTVTSST